MTALSILTFVSISAALESIMLSNRYLQVSLLVLIPAVITACFTFADNEQPAPAWPTPEVAVLTAQSQTLSPTELLPGKLEAWREAEVRARVAGVVLSRDFKEGAAVARDEILFQIDPAPYDAALARAKAELAGAEATLYKAQYQAKRVEKLRRDDAVSEQAAVEARADEQLAQAKVAAARAALKTAEINRDYATVRSPIDGRIGRALITEGALVGEDEATPLAVVQQIDPVYVSFTQSARQLLALRQMAGNPQLEGEIPVALVLDDGSRYPHQGKLLFTDFRVDPATARVTLRAEMPNPNGLLLPGLRVRVELQQGVYPNAFRVPQQAIERDESGNHMKVVDEQNQVHSRNVEIARAIGQDWLVTDGLTDGERFVVEGFQKIRPGSPVVPVPWQAPKS
jgi:membrane fusion protein (multidrug efflux system)